MNKEIQILITLEKGLKLVSVNSLYMAGLLYKAGKPVPYIYKASQAKRFEAIVDDQLRAVDFSEHMDWLRETKQFTMTQQYILKSGVSRRDCGNFEKLATDVITRFFKNELGLEDFDDSMFSDLHLYKSVIPGGDNEYLLIKISPSVFNMRFDIEPKPTKIWIHGRSLDDITAFLPPLPKKMKKKEHYLLAADHEEADTKVYILRPTEFIPLPATLIPAVYKDVLEAAYSGAGFVKIGIIGGPGEWERSDWEQLEWLKNETTALTKSCGNIRIGDIQDEKEILEWIQ